MNSSQDEENTPTLNIFDDNESKSANKDKVFVRFRRISKNFVLFTEPINKISTRRRKSYNKS